MKNIVLLLTALALGLAAYTAITATKKWREYEGLAQDAVEYAEDALAKRDSALAYADATQTWADSVAAAAAARADSILASIGTVLAESVPDTCGPFVARRDSIIRGLVAVVEDQRAAYDSLGSVVSALRVSNDKLAFTVDSLVDVLKARPRLPSVWAPKITVGPQVGVGLDGKPYAGVGLTIGWQVPLKDILDLVR